MSSWTHPDSSHRFTPPELTSRQQLWLLRILVPLGGMDEFIGRFGMSDRSLARYLGLAEYYSEPQVHGDEQAVARYLKQLHAEAESLADGLCLPEILERNLNKVADLAGLNETERGILCFSICLQNDAFLDTALNTLGPVHASQYSSLLATLLGFPLRQIEAAMKPGAALFQSGLILSDHLIHRGLSDRLQPVSRAFAESMYQSDEEALTFLSDMLRASPEPELGLDDYPQLSEIMTIILPILKSALKTRRRGINLFIHGPPGTGKTQLARVLAQELAVSLYEVSCEDESGGPLNGLARQHAYRAGQRFLSRHQAMMVFDEVEDVFDPALDMRAGYAHRSKGWMNRMLEENRVPTLWISNSAEHLDAAFVRRFTFCIALDIPARPQRQRILELHAQSLLSQSLIEQLAASPLLSPAQLKQTAELAIQAGEGTRSTLPESTLVSLINHQLRTQGKAPLTLEYDKKPKAINPDWFKLSVPADILCQGLKKAREARLCFSGPPGTGKTACAQWLSEQLDCPIHRVLASSLLSPWHGQTEQNIVRTFEQARKDGALLLLEEADSFLYARQDARHSWEASIINEMLAALEDYDGLLIACTNRPEQLDPAVARRFDHHLRFAFLSPLQAWECLQQFCEETGIAAPLDNDWFAVQALHSSSPGDFHLLKRRHRFAPFKMASEVVSALVTLVEDKPLPADKDAMMH